MSPIKVLHIVEVEKEAFYFNNLIDFIDRSEIEFSFVAFGSEGQFSQSMKSREVAVYALGPIGKAELPVAAKNLWSILKNENPQIVHTHIFNATFLGLTIAKWQNRKTVLTRHHSDAFHLLPSKLKRSFYLELERRNNRLADHIIAPSKMVRECLVDWEGTPGDKVSVIPYGQSSERYDRITPEIIEKKRHELKMNAQLSLVCVSRLFYRKGHQYLFEAFAALIKNGMKAKLYLVGEGDYREALQKLCEKLGIQHHVVFLGYRDDALEISAAADIIVHPSLEDALSQSLIEALMLQRPIVATDISGARDTLGGGKYGKIVPPADSESIQKALEETIENLEVASKKAVLGKAYLLKYMDAKSTADRHVEIYRSIVGRHEF